MEELSNRLLPVTDWKLNRREAPLVKGYLKQTGVLMVSAPPYVGKTTFAVNLTCSLAAGLDTWLDHDLNVDGPGQAVYVGQEGGQDLHDTFNAWQTMYPDADLSGLYILDGDVEDNWVQVDTKTGREAGQVMIKHDISRFKEEIDALDIKPRIIVFDTQIDLAPGISENDSGEAGRLYTEISRLSRKYRCIVALIHHTKKGSDEYRGSTAFFGKTDMSMVLKKEDPENDDCETILLKSDKVKGQKAVKGWAPLHFESVEIAPGFEGAVMVPGAAPSDGVLEDDERAVVEYLRTQKAPVSRWAIEHKSQANGRLGTSRAYVIINNLIKAGAAREVETDSGVKYETCAPEQLRLDTAK